MGKPTIEYREDGTYIGFNCPCCKGFLEGFMCDKEEDKEVFKNYLFESVGMYFNIEQTDQHTSRECSQRACLSKKRDVIIHPGRKMNLCYKVCCVLNKEFY